MSVPGIATKLELSERNVWAIKDNDEFKYSEGLKAERYLENAFSQSSDLSRSSYELESYIKDWPSEYHLSRARAQLLSGFTFDNSMQVLEVGCGCGAITRYLGETFSRVTAIEGSMARATLARMRTKELDNVDIVCAPFQQIEFNRKYDIIFCVGVFEYSNVFVDAEDPYDYVLRYFGEILTDDGTAIIAIENQFGLKYFSSSREDHTRTMFDGIEGYPRYGKKANTFGYYDLKKRISRHFRDSRFYFPYSDYKVPSCVLSEEFFKKKDLGELVGNFQSRDYSGQLPQLFDEKLASAELARNDSLPFFANSFLVLANKSDKCHITFPQLGIKFSERRLPGYFTETRFMENPDGSVVANKLAPNDHVEQNPVMRQVPCQSLWIDGSSVHTSVLRRVRRKDMTLKEIFSPCMQWVEMLQIAGKLNKGDYYIPGIYVDCTWSNSILGKDGCKYIDKEWEWHREVRLPVIVTRAIYMFLASTKYINDWSPTFKSGSWKHQIKDIAEVLGINISNADIGEFIKLESSISNIAYGEDSNSKVKILNLQMQPYWIINAVKSTAGYLHSKNICRKIMSYYK